MGFEQATIKVEKEKEYEELKSAISHVFSAGRNEKFLKRMNREGLRVRDWDSVLAQRVLEHVAEREGERGTRVVRGAAGFRPGADSGVLFVPGGGSGREAADQVSEIVSVLLRRS